MYKSLEYSNSQNIHDTSDDIEINGKLFGQFIKENLYFSIQTSNITHETMTSNLNYNKPLFYFLDDICPNISYLNFVWIEKELLKEIEIIDGDICYTIYYIYVETLLKHL